MGWIKLAGSWGHLLDSLGLAATFIIYGALFAGLVLLGSIWMVFPGEKPAAARSTAEAGASPAPAGKPGFTSRKMIRTLPFYLIFLTFVFGAGAGLMSIGLMKLYPIEALQRAGVSATEASVVAGTAMAVFFSLANGLGRILWGVISDRMGRKRSIVVMMTLQGFAVFAFIGMAGTPALLYLGAALIGFNFGGNFALFPTLTADLFGADRVGENYPFVFLAYGVGGILGPVLGGMLGDMGNFPLAFGICGALCWLGAVLVSQAKKPLV
jgi:MFS transporter, OFA family, oxalate/formate antiporter